MQMGHRLESRVDSGNREEGDGPMTTLTYGRNALPRRLDGTLDIPALLRLLCEVTLNEVMDAQADALCEELGTARNGYRERRLTASVGGITLRIPKLRSGTYFPDSIIERYSRCDRAVVAAVAEMYVQGVSTRKVQKVAAELGVDRMSRSQVSRICEALDEEVGELLSRGLHGMATPYLWLDATYIKVRENGRVAGLALVTAIGLAADGHRRVLGADVVDTESEASWRSFLLGLRDRGLRGVVCVTSDAHAGLVSAIERVLPGAAWQRCIVHLSRDLAACATSLDQRARVRDALSAVFREVEESRVRALWDRCAEALEGVCPRAAELMDEAEPAALAHLAFPEAHRRRLRTNNVQERMNRELKRRTRVVQVFPSGASLMRLVGAVLLDADEAWRERRWFDEHSTMMAYAAADDGDEGPAAVDEDAIAREAADVIDMALAGSVVTRRGRAA